VPVHIQGLCARSGLRPLGIVWYLFEQGQGCLAIVGDGVDIVSHLNQVSHVGGVAKPAIQQPADLDGVGIGRVAHFQLCQPVQKRVPFGDQCLQALLMLAERLSRLVFLFECRPKLTLPGGLPLACLS